MDFMIAKTDLNSALRQILQGRKKNSGEVVDITVDGSTAEFVVTGRSTAVPAQAETRGSASVPISIVAELKRICGTYDHEKLRIRVNEGKFRLQNTTISNALISMKKIASRIIDLPMDAAPQDYLCLPLIFSVDEIEDCGLHGKVLNAQKKLADDLNSAYLSLQVYGFDTAELRTMVENKIKAHADLTRRVLFASE